MSPYVNRADGSNTIFAAGNGQLQRLTRGSAATGTIWRAGDIVVAAPPEQKSTSFMSYTTSIHVEQMDTELPAPNAVVNLSANTRTSVYVNGWYYVLSSTPIQVVTDATVCATVVEATDGLHAAVLTVSLDNDALTVNPMDQAFAKLTAPDSEDKLRGAQFPSQTVAGGVVGPPEYTSLVPPPVTDVDVNAVAQHMGVLQGAYTKLGNDPAKKNISTVQASSKFKHDGQGGQFWVLW